MIWWISLLRDDRPRRMAAWHYNRMGTAMDQAILALVSFGLMLTIYLDRAVRRDMRAGFERIDTRLERIDTRFERVEERIDEHRREMKGDMAVWITQVDRKFDQVYERFDQVDRKFEQVDRKFDQVYERFDQVDRKFEQVYERIEVSASRTDVRINELNRSVTELAQSVGRVEGRAETLAAVE